MKLQKPLQTRMGFDQEVPFDKTMVIAVGCRDGERERERVCMLDAQEVVVVVYS